MTTTRLQVDCEFALVCDSSFTSRRAGPLQTINQAWRGSWTWVLEGASSSTGPASRETVREVWDISGDSFWSLLHYALFSTFFFTIFIPFFSSKSFFNNQRVISMFLIAIQGFMEEFLVSKVNLFQVFEFE